MRFGAVVAGGVAAVVVGAVAFGYISNRSGERDPVLAPPSGAAFNEDRALAKGPNRGSFSVDGRSVAVIDRGAVALAQGGALKAVSPPGGRVVDFAWMPNSQAVLVAEGPIPTGQVTVIDFAGKVVGTARLNPSIAFGSGYGMSVDSRGVNAAVIAVDRDAIGGNERRDLAVIELTTGKVTRLPTPDLDERQPVFIDDNTVAVLETADIEGGGVARVVAVDLGSGTRTPLDSRATLKVIGATDDGEVVVSERTADNRERVVTLTLAAAKRKVLATLPIGQRAVAADPQARRVLVATNVNVASASGTIIVTQLRAVDIARPSAGGGVNPG